MKKSIAIRLDHVSKKYVIHHEKPTLVERLIQGKTEEFFALRDITLTVTQGESIGIIGPNGAGKTTILKIIAGITVPTQGTVHTQGRIVSLIDIEAGFHPELTGEQNIYINGMLLGMSKKEIKKNLDRMIRFADIGKFIDVPLYTYSTGMKLRLGFAVAVHANPDIIIVDEGLSGGDVDFQKKSQQKIKEFFKAKKTFIFVSHWLEMVEQVCKRVVILEKGHIVGDGSLKLLKRYDNALT